MVNFYGYSWAIIACWTVMAFMIFNHLPTLSLPRWKLMFLNTSICIVVIGIVSTLHPETGSLILPETGGYLGVILGKTSLHVASFRAFDILAISAFFVSRTIRRKSEEAAFAGVLFGFTSAPLVAGFIFSNAKHSTKNGCSYLFQTFNKFSRDARIQQKLNSITKNLVTLTKGQQVGTIETREVRTECTPNTAQVDSFGTDHASPWRSSNDWVNDIDKQRVSENSLWEIPPMEVLEKTRPADVIAETFFETGDIIKNALASHGVSVEIADVIEGPNTIHFGLSPGWVIDHKSSKGRIVDDKDPNQERVKVDSILARKKDLSMVLKTTDITIHAPTPGKSWVGLEMPKPFRTPVALGDVLQTSDFSKFQDTAGLPLALGLDASNQPVFMDLTEAPHLLVAGESGSGKSASINSMICSLLMTRSPEHLRLILLDPKRVELASFQGLPHLDSGVIVEANEAASALSGLIDNLFTRLESLRCKGVRNIQEYNQIPGCNMPFIVVVVDELADLILQSNHSMEEPLVRIAQLGRAAGVHLILATQRPSSDVITGLLKANMPSRIAFSMSSAVDSRVLLGKGGAEVLLGKGDMLLSDNGSQTFQRIQGGMIKDHEIDEIVRYWTMIQGTTISLYPMNTVRIS